MRKLLYIERLVIAVLLLLLLTLAPAKAQNVVDKGQITPLTVEQKGADTYTWELFNDSIGNFVTTPSTAVADGVAQFVGVNTGSTVQVQWNVPGVYFFKVTAVDSIGCTNNVKIGKMKVRDVDLDLPIATITPPDTLGVCVGDSVSFEVTFTGKGTGPWDFTYTDGTTEWNRTGVTSPYTLIPDLIPITTTKYWITKVKDEFNTNSTNPGNTITQNINPIPNPSDIIITEITGGENTCLGPYRFEVTTAADHVYLWSVSGGTEGVDYSILNRTTPSAIIAWMNPGTTKTFTVIFTETNPVTHCTNDKSVEITVNPIVEPTIAYSPSVLCATGIAQVIFTGQLDGTFSSTGGLEINPSTGEIDLAASTPNNYTITYHYDSGACHKTVTTDITIKPVPNTSDIIEEKISAN